MLGLPDDIVQVHAYDTGWTALFQAERERIAAAIGGDVLDIQHVGSTSIPGMIAKPILDIGVAVANFEHAAVCIAPLQALGYEYRGEYGIPRRHYFVKGEPCAYHLHMVERESDDWRTMTDFRDYLIRHPELARTYAELKQRLAQQFADDRPAYQAGKAAFIEQILQQAAQSRD